jgi:hypothetical protein
VNTGKDDGLFTFGYICPSTGDGIVIVTNWCLEAVRHGSRTPYICPGADVKAEAAIRKTVKKINPDFSSQRFKQMETKSDT